MKNLIKYVLQKILGLHNYLYLFARFVILKLPYDKNEKDFLKFIALIEDGGHVLDIGANIGVMAYYFSRKLPASSIHAFEPVPDNLRVLLRVKQQLRLYNVKVYPFALGDKNGKVRMIMPELNKVYFHGLSHVEKGNNENQGTIYSVEIKRLSDIVPFNDYKISAIKVDVEEYEYEVLLGAKELINKNRPLIYCELWESENRTRSLEFMSKLSYKVYVNQGKSLIEFVGQKAYQNFFFIPAERCKNLKL